MRPLPFPLLVEWALGEYRRHGSIFGLRSQHFLAPSGRGIRDACGHTLATPVGAAAGPHTQLAQNIVTAWLAGARVIELKTVQVLDGDAVRAAVAKPCIDAEDEGFNCEWSTELTVAQAFAEYVHAHLAIAVLAAELGLDDDVVFIASVGYDLDGLRTPAVDDFIEGLRDASSTPVFRDAMAWLEAGLERFSHVDRPDLESISAQVCDTFTISTMHGCPADEIERMAEHLLAKGLHTWVKCNPTMLGYDVVRRTLDDLGYSHLAFDDHHFVEDLQLADAVAMFTRLDRRARDAGLVFGVKLSNTLPTDVTREKLPAPEMYLSGRALLPLTLRLAAVLARSFSGRLPISYAGGADATNVADLVRAGISPVTVCTTLLKPGGYSRLAQLAELSTAVMTDHGRVDVDAVDALVARVTGDARTHKRYREKVGSRKTPSPLPLTDCFSAPCEHGGCPIEQQVPTYLALAAAGLPAEAFRVVARDNTAPTITGVLCSQPCRHHCTRVDYDAGVDIRGVKLAAADVAQDAYVAAIVPAPLSSDSRVAVIGAGPAGIATAVFLRRNGIAVEVFERLDAPYGIVSHVIPAFRIAAEQVDRDSRLAVATGVGFHFGCDPDYDLADLRTRFDHVVLATGAWGRGVPPVTTGAGLVRDALDVLREARTGRDPRLGRRVAVIGAGDVAMDCARAALRADGVEHVTLVYRRTEPFMPAAQEDVNAVLAEGIEVLELLAPIAYDGALLRCERTELDAWAPDGRRSTRGTGVVVELHVDTVVGATGATVDGGQYRANGVAVDEHGHPQLHADLSAEVAGGVSEVYAVGDGRSGPDTVVRAIADAKAVARAILRRHGIRPDFDRPPTPVFTAHDLLVGRRGRLAEQATGRLIGSAEAERCLRCDEVCEICTEVCPNRANVAIAVPGLTDPRQIVHLDGLCNECGNCGTFCPHAGLPYRDKVTVFWSREDFDASTNVGFLRRSDDYLVRLPSRDVVTHRQGDGGLPEELERILTAVEDDHPWLLDAAPAALEVTTP